MKNKIFKLGAFLRIPLPDGTFAYGRQLEEPYTAFYNYRTKEPSADLDTIEKQPVLFRQAVRVLGSDKWQAIGIRKLEGEVTQPVVRFHQEIGDYRECTIFDNLGNERAATPEECIGLERASVWDAYHIEKRLLDTFEGRPNETEQRARIRLK
jgi:Immunity protein 26